jgi:hypothetical protein
VAQDVLQIPFFRILASGAAADKHAGLDGNAGQLHRLSNGLNVDHHGSRSAVGTDPHSLLLDFTAKTEDGLTLPLAGTRQADVGRFNAERFHEVQDLQLVIDRRIGNRWALQSIAQRLVIDHHVLPGHLSRCAWDRVRSRGRDGGPGRSLRT